MNTRDELRKLMRDGAVSGAWSDEQVRAFERRCSEFIGEHGDDLLAVVDAAEKVVEKVSTRPAFDGRIATLRAALDETEAGS